MAKQRQTDPIEEELARPREVKTSIPAKHFLSTGSTLLNLACSGRTSGGFPRGHYMLVVGDSNSGKTTLLMTMLAEAANNPVFDKHRLIYDAAEGGMLMDVPALFGSKLAKRIEPPVGSKEKQKHSSTMENFYDNINRALDGGPVVYVLDSMDALVPEDELDKEEKDRKDREKGKELKGTFGLGKPKLNSRNLRVVNNRLKERGSILIIISQSRDNIGYTATVQTKTRSGGHALRFYNRMEIWLSIRRTLTKTIGEKKYKIGTVTQFRIVKNHINGWEGAVDIPLYRRYGVDDTGSMVDFMTENGLWSRGDKGAINAKDLSLTMPREKLCQHIEAEGLAKELRAAVASAWAEVEAATAVKRSSRYE